MPVESQVVPKGYAINIPKNNPIRTPTSCHTNKEPKNQKKTPPKEKSQQQRPLGKSDKNRLYPKE